MERTYLNRLDYLEEEYQKEQKQVDDELAEAFFEKKKFRQELEALSENYRYHYQQSDFSEPINMSRVYHLLEQCQEEGERLVNQTMQELKDKQEENTLQYRQETKKLEAEIALLKEREGKEK